jgi:membrane protease YdiL (CAAX protease family)
MLPSSWKLWGEWLLLFALFPFVLWEINLSDADKPYHFIRQYFFILMWCVALLILWYRRKPPKKAPLGTALKLAELRPILWRFALAIPLVFAAIAIIAPERVLQLPLERPGIWLMVMFLYPVFSVFPQELIYRHFFFRRYAPLFGKGQGVIIMSALTFGHVHLLFNNAIAYILSIAGGYLFAITYAKTRNLWLVSLEHAIYGQLIFTSGLGWYFYRSGAAISG